MHGTHLGRGTLANLDPTDRLNLYTYCENNPVNIVDPSGLEGVGHHWIPQSVFKKLFEERIISEELVKYFDEATHFVDVYDHGFDTWNGVKHSMYNDAVERMMRTLKQSSRLRNVSDARHLVSWISTGKLPNEWRISRHLATRLADDSTLVRRWKSGFLKSITVAQAAKELNSSLTKAETKAISRRVVNADDSVKLSRRAAKVHDEYRGLSTAARRTLMQKAGRKAITATGIGAIFLFLDARRGFAGQGEKHPDKSGLSGAMHEAAYQAMMGPLVEELASGTFDRAGKLIAPAPSLGRRAAQSGVPGILGDAFNK